MSRFFHTVTSIIGGALVVIPHVVDVLPIGKAKAVVAAIGGALLWFSEKAKVMGG